jgi:hypothetical protein
MTTAILRSSNSRFVPALLVLGFLVVEVTVGGRALGAVVQQAVLVQSAMSHAVLQ